MDHQTTVLIRGSWKRVEPIAPAAAALFYDNLFAADPLVDTVVLGCTHYPLLIEKIKQFLPPNVQLVSQGDIVADSLADYLKRHPEMDAKCAKGGSVKFYTTENEERFRQAAGIFLNREIKVERLVL